MNFIINLFYLIIGVFVNGFVFMKLWLWFIVPIFDLKPLTIAMAIGITLVFNFVTMKIDSTKESTAETSIANFILFLSASGMFLLIGWIVSSYI